MTAPDSLFDAALAVHRSGLRGEFTASAVLRARLDERGDPGCRALAAALSGQLWHADPDDGRLPTLEALTALPVESGWQRSAVVLAAGELARAAILAWDVSGLRAAHQLIGELLRGGELAELRLAHTLRDAWLATFEGDSSRAAALTATASDEAAKLEAADAVIEAAALRALAHASAGHLDSTQLDEATTSARRASRMARTEAMPQLEYLANVVLARVRRLNGRPHLATRILTALHAIAPAPWHGWIAWELLLSGAMRRADDVELDAPWNAGGLSWIGRSASSGLRAGLRAAAAGDRAQFDGSMDAAAVFLGSIHPASADLSAVRVAIDPAARLEGASAEVTSWCRGERPRPPPPLRGICADLGAATAEEASAAWVVAGPSIAGRRVIAPGAPLFVAERRLVPTRGRPGRIETLVSALALAGTEGLPLPELFRTVYGFDYDAVVHRNLFKVLLHRARGAVADVAEIDRDDERLRLRAQASILVPDPRCEQPLEELVLRVLAREGRANAKSAAQALSIPLRTVQDALRQLADEGAVQLEKDGQRFQYHVEDTTFSEPTRSGRP